MTPALPERTLKTDLLALAKSQLEGGEFSFSMAWAMIRRRWTVLLVCAGLGLLAALMLCAVTPPRYVSQALLQITTRQDVLNGDDDMLGNLYASEAAIRSEVDVLTSTRLARRVVEKLDLEDSPAFRHPDGVWVKMGQAAQDFLLPLRGLDNPAEVVDGKARAVQLAAEILQQHLQAQIRPRSYTIELSYSATEPRMAAAVNNALIHEYLNAQLEERFEATRRASEWINTRMAQLQRQVQASDMAVEAFREAHGLTRARGVLLSEQQMSELNSQLILARTQLAEAQAKMDTASNGATNTSEVLNNPLIQNLRMQETEVRRQMSDLASRYGARHPRMQTVRNELRDVQSKIAEESAKIKSSLGTDVATAQARVDTLEHQLEQLQNDAGGGNDAAVKLAELERQAAAERTLYETFLNRSKAIAQLDFVQADARLIAEATPPLAPQNPWSMQTLAAGLVLGLALGFILSAVLEMLDMSFRSSQEMEPYLNLRALGLTAEVGDKAPVDYVLVNPSSVYSEGLRTIRTGLQFSHPDKKLQVLMVTSTAPKEGKSFFAASLAQMAATGGSKVLLVDADLRRPGLAEMFGLKPKAGLAEMLVGKVKAEAVVRKHSKGLDIVPTLADGHFAQELLGSARMREQIVEWRAAYDLIVLDCPPLLAVADAMVVSQLVDGVLYVIRWGVTPRPLVKYALEKLRVVHAPLAGCVLTRVDLERHAGYGYGDYGYYHDTYTGKA